MPMLALLLLFALAGCRFDESRPAEVADPDAWGRLDADADSAPAPAVPPGRA